MPSAKEQMNVWISRETIDKARKCATVQHTSLNQWVQRALDAQAEQDYESFQIEKLAKELDKVARRHLRIQPVSEEKMLAMAKAFAKQDSDDGLQPRYVPEPSPTKKARRPSAVPPGRKKR